MSLLPQGVGIGIPSGDAILVSFDEPMNTISVEAALQLLPATEASLSWNDDGTQLSISPVTRWQTDAGYLVVVDQSATTASGEALSGARRFAFTTQTAPTVSDFQVRLASFDLPEAGAEVAIKTGALSVEHAVGTQEILTPAETAREVSASSSIRITFSDRMDRFDAEERFKISPNVPGELSWIGSDLIFTPTERLESGGRYTISLLGARDRDGNELGGKANFSFVVRDGPQLTKTTPTLNETDVEPETVEMWFSQPMDVDATNEAFSLTDTATGNLVAGWLNWNEAKTQLVYAPRGAFAGSSTFDVTLGDGARDAEGNPIRAEWSFTTKEGPAVVAAPAPVQPTQRTAAGAPGVAAAPAPAAPAPAAPPPPPIAYVAGPSSGLEGYGLNQINSARASSGLPPLMLDSGISAVASAHAWDQLNYGYYSHSSRNGASVRQRLSAGGVSYGSAGENQCHRYGWGPQQTMDWCHSVFMAEPCCAQWNHIRNILSPNYTRVGIGVASNGSRVVITWDFAN